MSMMTRHKRRKLKSEINVVPYIDVMLVLLIIFMVTAPLLSLSVDVDLPKSSARAVESEKDPVVVTVDADGRYFLTVQGGKAEGMVYVLGALLVETPAGQRFKLGSGITDAERHSPPAVGTWVTYRYRGVNPSGLPRESTSKPAVRHSDSPMCMQCGVQMIRAGSCHACPSCGSTSGCS